MDDQNDSEFEALRNEMNAYNEKRDVIIKNSRDVTKLSKHAIFALHRKDFDKAETQLKDALAKAMELSPIIEEEPTLRKGSFAGGIEEYCEGRIFQHFLQTGNLLKKSEIPIANMNEYLGGILDFTGELNRYAVLAATDRNIPEVKRCKEIVDKLFEAFLQFDFRNGFMRKKFDSLKYTLKKMENLLYDLSLSQSLFQSAGGDNNEPAVRTPPAQNQQPSRA